MHHDHYIWHYVCCSCIGITCFADASFAASGGGVGKGISWAQIHSIDSIRLGFPSQSSSKRQLSIITEPLELADEKEIYYKLVMSSFRKFSQGAKDSHNKCLKNMTTTVAILALNLAMFPQIFCHGFANHYNNNGLPDINDHLSS